MHLCSFGVMVIAIALLMQLIASAVIVYKVSIWMGRLSAKNKEAAPTNDINS